MKLAIVKVSKEIEILDEELNARPGKPFKSYAGVVKTLKPGERVTIGVTEVFKFNNGTTSKGFAGYGEIELEADGEHYSCPRRLMQEI